MRSISQSLKTNALVLAIGALLGYAVCWHLSHPEPSLVRYEAAKAIPGGLKLETRPDATEKPRAPIPRGAKPTAIGQIIVKPKPSTNSAPGCSCDAIKIEYAEAIKDGQPSMSVTSSNADVTGGYHNPIGELSFFKPKPWAVGASIGTDGSKGVAVARDWGAIRAGVDVFATDGHLSARASLLLRF